MNNSKKYATMTEKSTWKSLEKALRNGRISFKLEIYPYEAEMLRKKGFTVRCLPFDDYLKTTEQQKKTKVNAIVTVEGAPKGSYAARRYERMEKAKALSHKKYREKARNLCHKSRIEWKDAVLAEIADDEEDADEEFDDCCAV